MEYKRLPWRHQLDGINAAKDVPDFGFFFEQGTGKTLAAINVARHKCEQKGRLLDTLIVCPLSVVENWKREWLDNSYVPATHILTLLGTQAKRVKDLDYMLAKGQPFICIVNYESLNMLVLLGRLQKWAPELMILDESQKIKNLFAKRTKHALTLGKLARHRMILSGTPVAEDTFDIFSQYLFLDNGETFGANYKDFRAQFYTDWNIDMPKECHFPDYRLREGAMKAMNALIYRKAMRVKKAECLDLPPLVTQEIEVELAPDQASAYTEMYKEGLAFCGNAAITGDLAIKKGLKLQEIVSGFVKADDGTIKRFKSNPKLSALEDVITQIAPDQKIIIWANFKETYVDLRGLMAKMKIRYVELTGEVPTHRKQPNIDEFTNSPLVRVAIANSQSVGIGTNLTVASYAIFFDLSFSWDLDDQARARNYRGGSEMHEKITQINIIAKNTIDEVKLCALRDKANLSEALLKYMRNHHELDRSRESRK